MEEHKVEDVEYLCVWAWKRRGGWAGGVLGSMTGVKQWEYRSVVVVGSTLCYYEMGSEDAERARGSIDLWKDQVSVQIGVPDPADNAPTPHQIIIHAIQRGDVHTNIAQGKAHMDGSLSSLSSTGSSAPSTAATAREIEWKLCFDQQEDMVRLMSVINSSLERGGAFQQKDVNRFEHDFAKGDHIYRWEMIVCPPVIYPIQIHAIVLEAGRNCLVVVDFGLTGYAKKKDKHFHHAEDNDEAVQKQILAAFRKLRPTDATQRLNIVTLTDQLEIRKWFKAGYDEESMLAKAKAASGGHHLGKIFHRSSKPSKADYKSAKQSPRNTEEAGHAPPFVPLEETVHASQDAAHQDLTGSSHLTLSTSSDLDDTSHTTEEERAAKKQLEKLPHSDPVEIVLARTNFCLEKMELLPPYHVFFSNSECIAVWCKTGRWSTLQTAVWCSTNSMGALKTSTLTTIGVAAANPLLAPVIAIGGLLWVSAPILILQKSRVAWEEYTRTMTGLFWDWAPNAVYVSAVENWTTVLKLQDKRSSSDAVKRASSPPSNQKTAVGIMDANNDSDGAYQLRTKLEDEKKASDDDHAAASRLRAVTLEETAVANPDVALSV